MTFQIESASISMRTETNFISRLWAPGIWKYGKEGSLSRENGIARRQGHYTCDDF